MRNLIRLQYDPAEAGSVGEAMLEAMNETPAVDKPVESAPATDKPATKFAWGDEERRKARAEAKDEDEFDLGYEREENGKKSPAKATLKQIRETAKWLHEKTPLINSALGMQEQFTKNPELSKAYTKWWETVFAGDKYNPEAVAKIMNALEGKAEVVKDKIEDNADDIMEAEKDLSELDSDSPQAKALRRTINSLKSVRTQLSESAKVIKDLQTRAEGQDKFKTDFEDTQKKDREDEEAKQTGQLFDKTFGALTSQDAYKFEDSDDSKEFEESVRDMVASIASQEKIGNDDEFKKVIQDSAKAAFEKISKRNEKIIFNYNKKKGKLPPEEEVKDDKKEPEEGESIGQSIAAAMGFTK